MKTVFITNDYRAGVAYTDYAILYRLKNGTTFRCLGLFAFCNRINNGSAVNVGDIKFIASPSYKKL